LCTEQDSVGTTVIPCGHGYEPSLIIEAERGIA
jgi:hypothetical protein